MVFNIFIFHDFCIFLLCCIVLYDCIFILSYEITSGRGNSIGGRDVKDAQEGALIFIILR